ncbi:Uncharacterised protein [Amycolatopsis camponoti]|uniref:Uncharacterized protein n=2 Tax=Amycolatopsis camponoti TaxID=2606593 RepID=A0A6I8M862_9PSEU|nr:Uncharacterised protein [Amycolatopsis camponoti]
MADEVARRTELPQLPSGRGERAVPHEGERIPLRMGGEIGFKKSAAGVEAYARGTIEAQGDGRFGIDLGHMVKVLCGSAVPGLGVAGVLALAGQPGWLIVTGGVGTMIVLVLALVFFSKEVRKG